MLLDPEKFAVIDKVHQRNLGLPFSGHFGVSIVNEDGTNASIQLKGNYSEAVSSGLFDGTTFASSLTSIIDDGNLVSQISSFTATGVISNIEDVTNNINLLNALPTGVTKSSEFTFLVIFLLQFQKQILNF